ncbi:hypothetical protein EVAR_35293_1 [Eumeta japonica]|uniref:Uncharacterized protein n=1 Tax=Eumeta variegata TaxID=151549 RepID=A0A4C1XJR2_EUMVA|nr:hypothetical protein EVAR_35293_1 [Eumeta japonica]
MAPLEQALGLSKRQKVFNAAIRRRTRANTHENGSAERKRRSGDKRKAKTARAGCDAGRVIGARRSTAGRGQLRLAIDNKLALRLRHSVGPLHWRAYHGHGRRRHGTVRLDA